jgi:hypothetical protein
VALGVADGRPGEPDRDGEIDADLMSALLRLPARQRQVVGLRILLDLDTAELPRSSASRRDSDRQDQAARRSGGPPAHVARRRVCPWIRAPQLHERRLGRRRHRLRHGLVPGPQERTPAIRTSAAELAAPYAQDARLGPARAPAPACSRNGHSACGSPASGPTAAPAAPQSPTRQPRRGSSRTPLAHPARQSRERLAQASADGQLGAGLLPAIGGLRNAHGENMRVAGQSERAGTSSWRRPLTEAKLRAVHGTTTTGRSAIWTILCALLPTNREVRSLRRCDPMTITATSCALA